MDSHDKNAKEVTFDWPGVLRVYSDSSFERTVLSPFAPPQPEGDPETGVASKDVNISAVTGLSARLYLPKLTKASSPKLPILVYFHGGGLVTGCAFDMYIQTYVSMLASLGHAIILSVDYRLAPEHLLPAAYEDGWTALNWVASLSDPWLVDHCDLEAIFIGGDSAGGNITHNVVMRAGTEGLVGPHGENVNILGAYIGCPYFLVPKEEVDVEITPGSFLELGYKIWNLVYPNAPGGFANPMIDPMAGDGAPSLAGLGCERVLIVVASEDPLKDVGVRYHEAVKESGFKGSLELFEGEGSHCFYFPCPDDDKSKLVVHKIASFLHE